MRTLHLCLCLAVILASSGCQTIDLTPKKWPWSKDTKNKKSQYQEPTRMVAIWTDTVRYSAGGQPTRGFGGRLYFYNDHGQAIPVEGQLAVYVYDDTDREGKVEPNRPPDRRYAFTKEQFTQHFSKSDLGASYSIWIPWDAVGGERKMLSILPVFTSVDNRVLNGQQSANMLPGKAPVVEEVPAGVMQTGVYDGQAVSFEKALANRQSIMQTTTINVPRNGAILGVGALSRQNPMTSTPVTAQGTLGQQSTAWQPQQARVPAWDRMPGGEELGATSRLPAASPQPSALEGSPQQAPAAQGGSPTRFERPRYRALGEPIGRLGRDHVLTRPHPSTLQ